MSKRRIDKHYGSLIRLALAQGWTRPTHTRRGHLRWMTPDGDVLFTPANVGEYRGTANAESVLRRAGLEIPPAGRRERS